MEPPNAMVPPGVETLVGLYFWHISVLGVNGKSIGAPQRNPTAAIKKSVWIKIRRRRDVS